MLRIRFLRVGKKNSPSFRLVVTPKESPPKGKFLEILGFYNPRLKEMNLKKERIEYWISQGAQPSDTIHNLLIKEGIIKGTKIPVHGRPNPKEEKEEKGEKKAPEAAISPVGKEEKGEGEGAGAPQKENKEKTEPAEGAADEKQNEVTEGKANPPARGEEQPQKSEEDNASPSPETEEKSNK